MRQLFVDSSERRQPMWQAIGLQEWERDAGAGPAFLVVHSSDVAMECHRDLGRDWNSAVEFEVFVRERHGGTAAILYISGAKDPLHPGKDPHYPSKDLVLDVSTNNPWTHVHMSSIQAHDGVFEGRLRRMLQVWIDNAGVEPPEWRLLGIDPLDEVLDYLTGLALIRDSKGQLLSYVRSNSAKFKGSLDRLNPTREERSSLSWAERPTRALINARVSKAIESIRRTPTELEARDRFEKERARISHDLFQNRFGACLLPGWRDDRLQGRDVVLKAVKDRDTESYEAVERAVGVWREAVYPALESFFNSVSSSYGFVTSQTWGREIKKLRSSHAVICGILEPSTRDDSMTPKERTRRFWDACDVVRRFLADLRNRTSEFFVRWDHEIMRDAPGR